MTDLESALIEAKGALEQCSIPYMLIGGLAVTAWGEARSTLDVDLAVWADPGELESAVSCICARLRSRTDDPMRFVNDTRVLPLESARGVRLDVVFGLLALQRESLSRAVTKEIAGCPVRVASVEDLVLMKAVSERPKDLADARALLRRFRKTLDRSYLAPKLEELAEALARPEIIAILRED